MKVIGENQALNRRRFSMSLMKKCKIVFHSFFKLTPYIPSLFYRGDNSLQANILMFPLSCKERGAGGEFYKKAYRNKTIFSPGFYQSCR
jgi:hypothetical protein